MKAAAKAATTGPTLVHDSLQNLSVQESLDGAISMNDMAEILYAANLKMVQMQKKFSWSTHAPNLAIVRDESKQTNEDIPPNIFLWAAPATKS